MNITKQLKHWIDEPARQALVDEALDNAITSGYDYTTAVPIEVAMDMVQCSPTLQHEIPNRLVPYIENWQKAKLAKWKTDAIFTRQELLTAFELWGRRELENPTTDPISCGSPGYPQECVQYIEELLGRRNDTGQ